MSEPASLKVFEHAFYIGSYLSAILYGIALILYFSILRAILSKKGGDGVPQKKTFSIVLSTALILLITIDNIANAFWGEQMWITFRDAPGGVPQFIEQQSSVWYQVLGSTSSVVLVLLGDALLIHRLFVIYGSKLWIIALPTLVWLTGFALAIIELLISGEANGSILHGKSQQFGVSYYSLAIAFNITLTLLIVFRLRKMGNVMRSTLGHESARIYTGVSAMLIESAAPYSMAGVMFLVPYAISAPTAIAFGEVWGKMGCLSPLMIIHRVVTRKAWDRNLVSQVESDLRFRDGPPATMIEMNGSFAPSQDQTTLPASHSNSGKTDWNYSSKSVV